MTKVLILGANGQLARNTTRVYLEKTDVALTLYLRRASRLRYPDPSLVAIVEGDVLDAGALRGTMQGHDVVSANLAGDIARQAHVIIDAMHAADVKRLIFVSSMGIYGEVPGETYRSVLDLRERRLALAHGVDDHHVVLPVADGQGHAVGGAAARINEGDIADIGHG